MKIGFVGLGNVGSKLAGSLLRNGYEVIVRDLNAEFMSDFVSRGAVAADSPKQLAQLSDLIITCLPSPSACSAVMEGSDSEEGIIDGLSAGKIWLEMSTTDESEMRRLGALVQAAGADPVDCPVSGGCHRADTGNISIFAGCSRAVFERALPVLTTLGRRVLHTGELGTASKLKVVTNYFATAHLVALGEALTACKVMDLDMNVSYEAIKAFSMRLRPNAEATGTVVNTLAAVRGLASGDLIWSRYPSSLSKSAMNFLLPLRPCILVVQIPLQSSSMCFL